MASQIVRPATVEDMDERGHAVPGTRQSADRRPAGDTASHVTAQTFATLASADSAKVLPCVPEAPKDELVSAPPSRATAPAELTAPAPVRTTSPEKRPHKRSGSRTSKKSSSHRGNTVHGYEGVVYPLISSGPVSIPLAHVDHYGQPLHPDHRHYTHEPYLHSLPVAYYDSYPQPVPHYATAPQSPVDQFYAAYPAYSLAYQSAVPPPPHPTHNYDGMPPPPLPGHHRRPMSFHAGMHSWSRDHPDLHRHPYSSPYLAADANGHDYHRRDYFDPVPPHHSALGAPPPRQALPGSDHHKRDSHVGSSGHRATFDLGDDCRPRQRTATAEVQRRVKRSSREYRLPERQMDEDRLQPAHTEHRSSRPSMRHARTYDDSERGPSRDSRARSYTDLDPRRTQVRSRDHSGDTRRSHRAAEVAKSDRASRPGETSRRTQSVSQSISPGHTDPRPPRRTTSDEVVDVERQTGPAERDSTKDTQDEAERYIKARQGGEYGDVIADTLRDSYEPVQPAALLKQKEPTVVSRSNSSKQSRGRRSSDVTKASSHRASEVRVRYKVRGEDGLLAWREQTLPRGPDGTVSFVVPDGVERHVREPGRERDPDRDRERNRPQDRELEHDGEFVRELDREHHRERARLERVPTPPERSGSHRHERSHSIASRFSKFTRLSFGGRSWTGSEHGRDETLHSRRRSSVRIPIHEDSRGEHREERRERRRDS